MNDSCKVSKAFGKLHGDVERMHAGVKQNPGEIFPQGEDIPGAKSRDFAAERAGFG